MYKLNPSDKWYKKALDEDEGLDVSAGSLIFDFNKLSVEPAASDKKNFTKNEFLLKHSFSVLLRKLRTSRELSTSELSKKIDVDEADLLLIEGNTDYNPSFRTINQIASYFELPYHTLAQIAGVITLEDNQLKNNLVKYAANSDKFEKLSKEEKKQLNEIIKLIKEAPKHT